MIHRFCITHTAPLLPASWYDDCIALGDFQSGSALHVAQLDRFWHQARPVAYGAAGSYVVPIAIEAVAGASKLIEISSYRKRVLLSAEGEESQSYGYPAMREVGRGSLELRADLATFTPRDGVDFLVSQPLFFKNSILGQYAESHHRKDILEYTRLATEMGVLNSDSASEFLDTKYLIPGGVELGLYPKSWIVPTMSKIESVGREFLIRNRGRLTKYDNYQVRAVGFLSERLGSFLLLRHLVELYSNRIPADVFGFMTVLVEGDTSYSTGLAKRIKSRTASGQFGHKQAI